MTAKDGVEVVEDVSQIPGWSTTYFFIIQYFFKYFTRDTSFYFSRFLLLMFGAFYQGTLFAFLPKESKSVSQYAGTIFYDMSFNILSVVIISRSLVYDRTLVLELTKNGIISPMHYCIAQFMATIPIYIISSSCSEALFFWLAGLNPNFDIFFYVVLLSILLSMLSEGIMLIIVEVFKDALLSLMCFVFVGGAVLLLSGFLINVTDIPFWFRWICYIVPTKVRHFIFHD